MLMAAKPRYWPVLLLLSVSSLQGLPSSSALFVSVILITSGYLSPYYPLPSLPVTPCSENSLDSVSFLSSLPGPVPQGALHPE